MLQVQKLHVDVSLKEVVVRFCGNTQVILHLGSASPFRKFMHFDLLNTDSYVYMQAQYGDRVHITLVCIAMLCDASQV